MPEFSPTSLAKLGTCHKDLQALFLCVIREADCMILCGHRGQEDQDAAYRAGKSKLMWPHGKHNTMPSLAVDVAPWPLNWDDAESFKRLADVVKKHAAKLEIEIEWGGDWTSFVDLPHYQLKVK